MLELPWLLCFVGLVLPPVCAYIYLVYVNIYHVCIWYVGCVCVSQLGPSRNSSETSLDRQKHLFLPGSVGVHPGL